MIETWGFYFFGLPKSDSEPGQDDYQRLFDRYLDLWVRCEGWGFDGIALAEHHFNSHTLSPSPHLIVASVAGQTTKLRFTVLGTVLPMNDARRYAEECGMLRYMTNGRFEPGIGPGAGVAEIVKAGIPGEEARPRYYSGAELLRKALADKRVTHQDEFYNLEGVSIEPPPYLRSGRSVWTTVLSPDSAAWAAERGFKMCTAWHKTTTAAAVGVTTSGISREVSTTKPPMPLGYGLIRRWSVCDAGFSLPILTPKPKKSTNRQATASRPMPEQHSKPSTRPSTRCSTTPTTSQSGRPKRCPNGSLSSVAPAVSARLSPSPISGASHPHSSPARTNSSALKSHRSCALPRFTVVNATPTSTSASSQKPMQRISKASTHFVSEPTPDKRPRPKPGLANRFQRALTQLHTDALGLH